VDYIDRETGQFPLSIGTSLALEGLLGVHPQAPKQPSGVGQIGEVWVNLRTLIRNFYAAMTVEVAAKAPMELAAQVLCEELGSIPDVLNQHARGRYILKVYHNDLTDFKWQFPHAVHKTPKTEKQRQYHTFETLVLKLMLLQLGHDRYPVLVVKRYPDNSNRVAALLTHHTHELLWRTRFSRLFLLESHTGRLKSTGQWGGKLNGVSEDDHLPLNEFTLQLFGERQLLGSMTKKLRDETRQLAVVRHWTAVTTVAKIRNDVMRYGGENLKRAYHEVMVNPG